MNALTLFVLYWLGQQAMFGHCASSVGICMCTGERTWGKYPHVAAWLLSWSWPLFLLWLLCGRPRA